MTQKPTIMNTKKFNRKQLRAALALLCIVSGSLVAMSFTSSPAESNSAVKAGTTYYVTGVTTISGQPAYTFDENPQNCEGEGGPCRFVTESGSLSSPQLQSVIDGEEGLSIETRKN